MAPATRSWASLLCGLAFILYFALHHGISDLYLQAYFSVTWWSMYNGIDALLSCYKECNTVILYVHKNTWTLWPLYQLGQFCSSPTHCNSAMDNLIEIVHWRTLWELEKRLIVLIQLSFCFAMVLQIIELPRKSRDDATYVLQHWKVGTPASACEPYLSQLGQFHPLTITWAHTPLTTKRAYASPATLRHFIQHIIGTSQISNPAGLLEPFAVKSFITSSSSTCSIYSHPVGWWICLKLSKIPVEKQNSFASFWSTVG